MTEDISAARCDHTFGQGVKRSGETRTLIVTIITLITMVLEITAGILTGSMALLADGLHMGSHAAALGIAVFAYRYARKHAANKNFSFGTGKINSLAGYSSAMLLGLFALLMIGDSVKRFFLPVEIFYNEAIAVAVLGLIVNAACLLILKEDHHGHDHAHHHGHDHNLIGAYLHVLTDALTSVLAIVALLLAKYAGLVWMDPVIGIVGGILVARWGISLMKSSAGVLTDAQAPQAVLDEIKTRLEAEEGTQLNDLHVWSIGPNIYAAEIVVRAATPKSPDAYRALLPESLCLRHVVVEVAGG